MRTDDWMYLSARLDYALRALSVLRSPPGHPLTATELADEQQVPATYLRAILNELRAGGLLVHERGRRGGYRLARPPADITICDVLAALRILPFEVHPTQRGRDEFGQTLSEVWRHLEDSTLNLLRSISVADLAAGSSVRRRSPATAPLSSVEVDRPSPQPSSPTAILD